MGYGVVRLSDNETIGSFIRLEKGRWGVCVRGNVATGTTIKVRNRYGYITEHKVGTLVRRVDDDTCIYRIDD